MMDNCTGGSLLRIGQSDNTIDKKMLKIPGTRIQSDIPVGGFGGAVGLIFFSIGFNFFNRTQLGSIRTQQ